jgi:hypothetical protein
VGEPGNVDEVDRSTIPRHLLLLVGAVVLVAMVLLSVALSRSEMFPTQPVVPAEFEVRCVLMLRAAERYDWDTHNWQCTDGGSVIFTQHAER